MNFNEAEKDYIIIITNNDNLKRSIYDAIGDDYSIITVDTVQEALSVITLKLPNLFIADIDPEYSNGIELVKKLRNGIKTRLTPFILISSDIVKSKKIEAIEMGADDYITFPFDFDEFRAIIKLRLNKFREFYLLSVTDELTRLYNRKEFINKFQNEIINHPKKKLSLSILDIDFFKKVNDVYGHQMGDIVLMRLADLLKNKTDKHFFPARFGGEEFVILHPDMNMQDTKKIMDELLNEFSNIEFRKKDKKFNITFSAGIAEYPIISQNVSELLSRADQALYSAKEEGRNRIYIFDQLMSRNDKFWKYLNSRKNYYIDKKGNDLTTGLPYLPVVLEEIMLSDYEIASIGLIVIKIQFLDNIEANISRSNLKYDVENIKMIINHACKKGFPSDIHIAISSFFNLEFVILFPSITDFSAELEGFNKIAFEICKDISYSLKNLNIDISCNSGVLFEDKEKPNRLYSEIEETRNKTNIISTKNELYRNYLNIFKNKNAFSKLKNYFLVKFYYDVDSQTKLYQFIRLKEMKENSLIGQFLKKILCNTDDLQNFLKSIKESQILDKEIPYLFPYFKVADITQFSKIVSEIFEDQKVILLISENELTEIKDDLFISRENIPKNIGFGLRDSYIDKNILNYLSIFEFDLLLFSDNILRNIHFFKERINIVNGLKLFLDQINIPSLASGISIEEEFILLRDLKFNIFSGEYIESKLNCL